MDVVNAYAHSSRGNHSFHCKNQRARETLSADVSLKFGPTAFSDTDMCACTSRLCRVLTVVYYTENCTSLNSVHLSFKGTQQSRCLRPSPGGGNGSSFRTIFKFLTIRDGGQSPEIPRVHAVYWPRNLRLAAEIWKCIFEARHPKGAPWKW
jgi:hypothetical protein